MSFEEKSADYANFGLHGLLCVPGARLDTERFEIMVPVSLDGASLADLIDQLQMFAYGTDKDRFVAFMEASREARMEQLEKVGQAVGQLKGRVVDLRTWRGAFGKKRGTP